MKRFLLAILLVPLFSITAHGDESSKPNCRIVFLDRPANSPTSLYLFDGSKSLEVALPGMNFSPVYELTAGTKSLTLLKEAPAEGQAPTAGVPTVEIPEGARNFYLIATPDPENEHIPIKLRILAWKNDLPSAGDMLFLNLTGKWIEGTLGDQTLSLEPDAVTLLGAPKAGEGDYPVKLGFRNEKEGDLQPLTETRWIHNPRSRMIGFVTTNRTGRLPSVKMFTDFR